MPLKSFKRAVPKQEESPHNESPFSGKDLHIIAKKKGVDSSADKTTKTSLKSLKSFKRAIPKRKTKTKETEIRDEDEAKMKIEGNIEKTKTSSSSDKTDNEE